jgi:hypothetical protein
MDASMTPGIPATYVRIHQAMPAMPPKATMTELHPHRDFFAGG